MNDNLLNKLIKLTEDKMADALIEVIEEEGLEGDLNEVNELMENLRKALIKKWE